MKGKTIDRVKIRSLIEGELLLLLCSCSDISNFSASPWTVAHQTPLSVGFPRQESWRELPFPSPGDLPDPGIQPSCPALAGGFFTTDPPGKPDRGRGGGAKRSSTGEF